MTTDLREFFGEPIFTYTTDQAIEDGVLVDLTPQGKAAGIGGQVVCTRGVWVACVEGHEDEPKRAADLLWAMRGAIFNQKVPDNRVDFKFGGSELYAIAEPGKVTIMLEGED